MEDVATAQRLFENIKKKFNVRRKNSKGPSGSGAADMSAQQEDFKDMAYLSWLAPFVKLRQTKSNMNFKAMTSAARADKLMSVSENEGGESEEEESTVSVVDVEPLEPLDDNETLENEDETTTNKTGKSKVSRKSSKVSETTQRLKWHQKKKT